MNGLLQNAGNNYVYGSIVAGAVLPKRDDLQVQFNYYGAHNYNQQVAVLSTPCGASARDISLTVGLKHKFTDRMVGEFKVGYFASDNPTMGGNTNLKGPWGYFSLNNAL